MKLARVIWRLARALGHSIVGLLTIWWVFPRIGQAERDARVQAWSREALALLGIRLVVQGVPPARGPVLLVANHTSWLDITSMHAARHCRFVSKAEIKRWPVIGTLSTASGTVYIERESRRDALRTVHGMAASLAAGDILAVFPEGTTGDGREVLPFHGNLLQAAIATDSPVQPVALRFVDATTGQPSTSPLYVGDDTLLGSIWRTVSGPPLEAVVCYGQPQRAQGRNRREWAAALRLEVRALLQGQPADPA